MAVVPVSFSAVESNNLSILYYARNDGSLAELIAQQSGEDPRNPPYKSAYVLLDGDVVETSGAPQIRLYYIGGNQNDGFKIRELAQTNGNEWRDGALNHNDIHITKDSHIAANVESGQGDVKVFFNQVQADGSINPAVAWAVKGTAIWSSRAIGKWQ
ncbi:hypothetical protein P7C71_g4046, partial [Lecanoromycetidae sp. Uapishka_2]